MIDCTYNKNDIIDYTRKSSYLLFGDTVHDDPNIIEFLEDAILELEIDRIFLELPFERESRALGERRNEMYVGELTRDGEWSRHPEHIASLIKKAQANGIKIHFADDEGNLLKFKDDWRRFTEISNTDPKKAETLASTMLEDRMSVNQTVAQRIREETGTGRSATLFGYGHFAGIHDIDEMLGDEASVIAVYPDADIKKVVEVLTKAMLGEVEDADHCVYLATPPPPANLPTVSDHELTR